MIKGSDTFLCLFIQDFINFSGFFFRAPNFSLGKTAFFGWTLKFVQTQVRNCLNTVCNGIFYFVFIPDIVPSLNRIFEAISMEDEKKREKKHKCG